MWAKAHEGAQGGKQGRRRPRRVAHVSESATTLCASVPVALSTASVLWHVESTRSQPVMCGLCGVPPPLLEHARVVPRACQRRRMCATRSGLSGVECVLVRRPRPAATGGRGAHAQCTPHASRLFVAGDRVVRGCLFLLAESILFTTHTCICLVHVLDLLH